MLNREFFYWIVGYFDLADTCTLSEDQWEMVQRHLELMLNVSRFRPSLVAIMLENEPEDLVHLCRSQILGTRPSESEICYYLQGYFEISGATKINETQRDKIIDLFLLNNIGLSYRGVDIFVHVVRNSDNLKDLLNDIFQHAIDISYGLSDEEMILTQRIHDGEKI